MEASCYHCYVTADNSVAGLLTGALTVLLVQAELLLSMKQQLCYRRINISESRLKLFLAWRCNMSLNWCGRRGSTCVCVCMIREECKQQRQRYEHISFHVRLTILLFSELPSSAAIWYLRRKTSWEEVLVGNDTTINVLWFKVRNKTSGLALPSYTPRKLPSIVPAFLS